MGRRIWVTVKPQARKEEISRLEDGGYRVAVCAPAEAGRANEAVIELLADFFSVPKTTIKIVRGRAAKRKLIEIG